MTVPAVVIGGWILSGKKEANEKVSEASPRRVDVGRAALEVVGRVSRVLSL